MAKRKRWAFTKEFKAEAVRVVQASGKTVGAVARSWISQRRPFGSGFGRPRSMQAGGSRGR